MNNAINNTRCNLARILRRHVVHVFMGVSVAMLQIGAIAHAQVIIEEDDGYRSPSAADKFFGKASVTTAGGSGNSTMYQALEVGYDTRFANERGRFYFSGIATNTDIELDLEVRDEARGDGSLEPMRTRKISDDDFDVRDAFLQFDVSDNFVFSLGRRRVAWGQFDLVSPVNLALPLTPQTAELTSGKIDTMVPQDQLGFAWYPNERVELQGFFFASTRVDSLIRQVVEDEKTETIFMGDSRDDMEVPVDNQDLEDHTHYGLRLLFYRDWGTFGFTYHDGRDALVFSSDMSTVNCNAETMTASTACPDGQALNVRRHTDLPEATNIGFEVAVPRGNWVYKFEALMQESMADLQGFSEPGGDGGDTRIQNFLNRIRTENDGKLFLPVDRQIFAFGADSDRENWRFNLSLMGFNETYEKQELVDEEELIFGSQDRGSVVFPVANIARYIGGNKRKELGFIGGFLGPYAGVSVYYKSHIGENLRWLVGGEALQSLRNDLAADSNTEEETNSDRYELADDVATGLRLSLIYDF